MNFAKKSQLGASFWAALAVVVMACVLRLIPHPPNFSPIGAMALFGGAYLVFPALRVVLPVLVLFLSDVVLGFHDQMVAVYASVILVSFLGIGLGENATAKRVMARSLLGSVLFFVITNFAVWLQSGFYPRTLSGLAECYWLALPFFQNSVAGDLVYTALFFGGWALARRWIPVLRTAQ